MKTYTPEKLNLWDRIFNRYRTIPISQESQKWSSRHPWDGSIVPDSVFYRDLVFYHKIDRLTGSYKIIKKYLD